MKTCQGCLIEKPLSLFAKDRRGKPAALCVSCKVERNRFYRARRRQQPEWVRAMCRGV